MKDKLPGISEARSAALSPQEEKTVSVDHHYSSLQQDVQTTGRDVCVAASKMSGLGVRREKGERQKLWGFMRL
jgi:hypothetical protein